jgi:hypothetical protein
MKLRVKGHRFDATEEIHAESQPIFVTQYSNISREEHSHIKWYVLPLCMMPA